MEVSGVVEKGKGSRKKIKWDGREISKRVKSGGRMTEEENKRRVEMKERGRITKTWNTLRFQFLLN